MVVEAPRYGTPEYRLWAAGAEAEAKARREGRSKAGRDVESFVDALAEHHHEMDHADIACWTFSVFGLTHERCKPLRMRIQMALWVLRGGKGRAPLRTP
jgi:hypothetical protein